VLTVKMQPLKVHLVTKKCWSK